MFSSIFQTALHVYFIYVIVYFIVINIVYTVLLVLSYREIMKYMRHNSFSELRPMLQSELTPPVSILAPAFNEEPTVVESVKSLLKLNYGKYEVVVINDGSKDKTLDVMRQEFNLYASRQVYRSIINAKPVRGR